LRFRHKADREKTRRTPFAFFLVLTFIFTCSVQEERNDETSVDETLKPRVPVEGRIVFHSNLDGDNEIYLLTSSGVTPLTQNTWNDEYPVWSPDGGRIAFTSDAEGQYDIWVMEADGSGITRLTTSPAKEKDPAWFPDGEAIAFTREVKKFLRRDLSLFRVDVSTGSSSRIIPGYRRGHAIPHVSPLGDLLTFTGKRRIGWDAAVYDLKEKKAFFLDEGGKSCRARFSPDGRKLAYVSSKADGKGDIWLMNPDGSGKKRLTERDETYDYFPSWSPDGRFVVFNSSRQHDHNGDWALYLVEIQTGKVTLLFDSEGNDVFPDWAPEITPRQVP